MSDTSENEISQEFKKVLTDFIGDIKTTFPEYKPLIAKFWKDKEDYNYIEEESDRIIAYEKANQKCLVFLLNFCKKKYPPRFFDILYQNNSIFAEDSDVDTELLPKIHFKNLWSCEITDKTRDTIWKYLQLILLSIVGNLDNKEVFGDTAKLFDAINEDDFKSKLEETLKEMQNMFSNGQDETGAGGSDFMNFDNLPKADDIKDHITGMLDGKIGRLAQEIAEEAAGDLNMDVDNDDTMKNVFEKMLKNPTKLMGIMKKAGDKLQEKIKSGEIKESEIIEEATEFMHKMKDIPGLGSMLGKMGMGGMGGKMNMGAMESQLNKNLKMAKTKERIRAKAEAKHKEKMEQQAKEMIAKMNATTPQVSQEEIIKLFSEGEKQQKTPRKKNNKK